MNHQNLEKIKVAILGGALNSAAGSAHFSALRLVNQYEIVAGCFSRDFEINRQMAFHYGVDENRIYESFDLLINEEKGIIDALIILTPTDQHSLQVLKCIKANIPVICEKALACNSLDAFQIKDELSRNNGFLSVIYNYLGYPMIRELKEIISSNRFGLPHHIQIEMPQEGFNRIGLDGKPIIPQDWRLHDGIIPTISLDLGVHLHMMIKYLTGEYPISVVATSESYGNFPEVQDNISSIINYSNNISCNMWYSKIATGKRNGLSVRIYLETGSAEWIQEYPENLYLSDNQGNRWVLDRGSSEAKVSNQERYTRFKAGHPAGFIEAFANYYTDIAFALEFYKQNKSPFMNSNCFGINESIEGLLLFEAMSKSSKTGMWQEIEY